MEKHLSILYLIKRCNNVRFFRQIHGQLVTSGDVQEPEVLESLVSKLLVKKFFCSDSSSSGLHYYYFSEFLIHYFHSDSHIDVNSFYFNSLIAAYASSAKTPEATVLVYRRLVQLGFVPDLYTFPVILKSCVKISATIEGKQFHGSVVKLGYSSFDLYVQNSLVHFYGACGECDDASKMFDEMAVKDVVSWTGLISGYVKSWLFKQALILFSKMTKMDVEPNNATLVSAVVASGRLGDRRMGKALHGLISKRSIIEMATRTSTSGLKVGNALMDMYVKCKCLDDAKQVFYDLGEERDAISWTCIISGLVQCERPTEALELFNQMHASSEGMTVLDTFTLSSVLTACASLGAVDQGRLVHEYIERNRIEWDSHIGTALVDMYAKCGCIELALQVFRGNPQVQNTAMWNALLGGLAMHGYGNEALNLFEEMIGHSGVRPNEVTFLAVLSACCHCGLVEEGLRQFDKMRNEHCLIPKIEHYGCMVDLLGRAGLLNEAQEMIKSMPMEPDVLIWGSLLSACKAYGNIEMCQDIQKQLDETESTCRDSGVYVLMSNIYACNDRWQEATKVRHLMKKKGIKKSPGSSVIEVNSSNVA